MARFLSQIRCTTDVASDATSVLAKVVQFRPHLVLISDAVSGGHEICHCIKGDPALVDTKVLLVITLAELSQLDEAAASGADDFISKGGGQRELLNRVAVALEKTIS